MRRVLAGVLGLAALLAADVAGYSRLMGLDEEGTLARKGSSRPPTQILSVAPMTITLARRNG
jgi:hypothetical protein